ncbi:alpha/beta fold hydrolase [Alteromonas facilis]|uniref:alpha/beta fold hydrolase n=1 Tax=Alteromonas facilis TaxID=2048004 RepID=UPI001F0CB3CE|nr:alpha/beta hydrolase [Alteromonas facilis]
MVEHLCVHLGLVDVSIVAHDYGDSVAQELLTRQVEGRLPFTIQRLMWLNGGLFSESHRPLLTQKLLHSKLGPLFRCFMSKNSLKKGFTRIFAEQTPPSDEVIDNLWALMQCNEGVRVLPSLLRYLDERKEQRDRWVGGMQTFASEGPERLIFVNGVQDPISGQHMLERFKTLLPNVPTLGLDVGHYPQLEAAEKVNDAIIQFLSEF